MRPAAQVGMQTEALVAAVATHALPEKARVLKAALVDLVKLAI